MGGTRIKLVAIPFIVAIVSSLMFFAVSVAATFLNKAAIRGHVAAAFSASHYGGLSAVQDCIILYELLAPYDAGWEEALFPKIKRVPEPSCTDVQEALAGEQHAWSRYTRYLHGQRTLAGILISQMELATAGRFLLLWAYSVLAGGVVVLLWRRWRAGETTPGFAFGLVLFLCLIVFHVTPRHGTSPAFGSADGVIYLLLLLTASLNLSRMSVGRLTILAAFSGATTAYVEFLTGQAPLAFAALIALVAATTRADAWPRDLMQRYLSAGYAFVAAFVAMFAIKLAVVSPLEQDPDLIFAGQLLYQMAGSVPPESQKPIRFGIDITQHAMYSWQSLVYAAIDLGYAAQTLCRGSVWVGITLVFAAMLGLVIGGASRCLRLDSGLERTRTIVLAAAAAVVPIWYLIFLHHTIIGAEAFMIRPLVVSLAIGVWLGCSEIAQRLYAASYQPETVNTSPFAPG